jgi:hypothetical protein
MTGKMQAIAVRGAETMQLGPANLKINRLWSPLFPCRICEILCKILNQDGGSGSCDENVNLWGTSCWLGRRPPAHYSHVQSVLILCGLSLHVALRGTSAPQPHP